MDWNSYLGHHRQRGWLRNAISSGRLASTFLLVGSEAIGKRTFARVVAKSLLCTSRPPESFDPCGNCEACVQIEAGTHPDFIQIAKHPDKTSLAIDQFIGPEDNRMREGFCYEIRMRPYSGRRKIAVIDDADTIGVEAANSLLKTLEEPPPGSVIFLISTSLQRQLPTIRSRCQVVRFQNLSADDLAELALRRGLASTPEEAKRIGSMANGTMAAFDIMQDEVLREFRQQLHRQLMNRPLDISKFAKGILANVDSVGNDSQRKRERLKLLIDFAQSMFSHQMRELASKRDPRIERRVQAIQRCLEAKMHVDRNVAPAALVEAWAADLASIVSAG